MSDEYAKLTVSLRPDGTSTLTVRADNPNQLAEMLDNLGNVNVYPKSVAAAQAFAQHQGNGQAQQAPQAPQQPADPWGGVGQPQVPQQPQQPAQQGYQYQQPTGQTTQSQGGGYPEDPGKADGLARLGLQAPPVCDHGPKLWKNPPAKPWQGFFCSAKQKDGNCSATWVNYDN